MSQKIGQIQISGFISERREKKKSLCITEWINSPAADRFNQCRHAAVVKASLPLPLTVCRPPRCRGSLHAREYATGNRRQRNDVPKIKHFFFLLHLFILENVN